MAALKTTRAHYTCGCVVEYDWLDGDGPRVHENHRTIKTCHRHSHIRNCAQRDAAAIEWCKNNQPLELDSKGKRK